MEAYSGFLKFVRPYGARFIPRQRPLEQIAPMTENGAGPGLKEGLAC